MDAINDLILKGAEVLPVLISGIPRIEIDFVEDLEVAHREIFPNLT
jgi:hypothetical protein